ncbi:MAG: PhnD/SsuA/transferrin family substrate-binding protein, partial [Thermodesulfobacteriota bacterium]
DLAKSLAAWRLLEKHGIRPATDLANFKHDGSCESIALNVFLKSVDAGMVCDYSFEDINEAREHGEGEIPPHQLRVLARTEEVPTWVFAALKGTDQNLVLQVARALTALNRTRKEHRNVLEEAEAGGFVPARDSDFDGVRKMLPSTRRVP